MDKTQKRFAFYAKTGLLCGNDGLPHLISDPGLAFRYGHAGDIVVSDKNPEYHQKVVILHRSKPVGQ